MLTRGSVHGAEQYVLMPKAASNQLRYEVTLGEDVAGLRQVKGSQSIEFLDKTGTPRLHMTASMALTEAKNGEDARRVALRLKVTDCASGYDCRAGKCEKSQSVGTAGTVGATSGGPEQTEVTQGEGCALPGNGNPGKYPWKPAALVLGGLALATRRRR